MAGKDALSQAARTSRAWAQDRWGAFRRESPYFQARVWLVVGYVAVVLLTVLLAPPEGEHWACKAERIPFGLAFKTAITLDNIDNGELEGVTVEVTGKGIEYDGRELPGVWRTRPFTLAEGEMRVQTEELFDEKGVSPPYTLVVTTVRVFNDDGELVVALTPKQVGGP